jgi:hypothetical protein
MTIVTSFESGFTTDYIFDPFLFNFNIPNLKNGKLIPRLKDF